jgi:hypothetical protein
MTTQQSMMTTLLKTDDDATINNQCGGFGEYNSIIETNDDAFS